VEASNQDEAESERTGGLTCCDISTVEIVALFLDDRVRCCLVEESLEFVVAARNSIFQQ